MSKPSNPSWGIDLGGTKIEGVVLGADFLEQDSHPEPLCRIRVPTEADQGYEHILDQITALIQEMRRAVGTTPEKLGFGTPGVLDPATNLLKNSNTVCLNGMPLEADLERALGVPCVLANDANCFALAEHLCGAARGHSSSFGVIIGTGVGGGLILDGRARYGHQGIAGEWGHMSIEDDGEECYCGGTGCVETVISGPSLERYYEKASGQRCSLIEIVERAERDAAAKDTIDRLCFYFAKGLSHVINIVDPDIVVLGGGLSNIEALYSKGMEHLEHFVFNTSLQTRVVSNALGDSAGVFGSAMLVQNS